MGIAVIIGLVLQALSVLVEWLMLRKQKKQALSPRLRRVLGNVLYRMDAAEGLMLRLGVTPKKTAPDDETIRKDAAAAEKEEAIDAARSEAKK